MASKQGGPVSDDPAAHSVAVQLPTFNRLAPSSWFILADANFHLPGITKSDTKFWYVVSKLDQETLQKLSSFLAMQRGEDPYAEVRAVLCKTYEPKLEQKIDALLAANDIGDERPAEYVLELRRLLSTATTDDILKRIFVRSLPKHIINAISANMDDSLDGLVDAAEKAWTLAASLGTSVSAVAPQTSSASGGRGFHQRGGQHRGGQQRGGRTGRQESKAVVLCPFHLKWGESARKCLHTCSRWQGKSTQVFQVEEIDQDQEN